MGFAVVADTGSLRPGDLVAGGPSWVVGAIEAIATMSCGHPWGRESSCARHKWCSDGVVWPSPPFAIPLLLFARTVRGSQAVPDRHRAVAVCLRTVLGLGPESLTGDWPTRSFDRRLGLRAVSATTTTHHASFRISNGSLPPSLAGDALPTASETIEGLHVRPVRRAGPNLSPRLHAALP